MNKNTKSFGEWCEENNLQVYLDYWCNDINEVTPWEIGFRSHKKIAFKCGNPDHPVFYKDIGNIAISKNTFICPACNSFGQYVIDTMGKDYLDAIWSDKNKKSYYEISKSSSHSKVWLRCLENENHPDYQIPTSTFYTGHGCPYCSGNKVCFENSLLHSMPEIVNIWSEKNSKGPDEYTTHSKSKVWLKCKNGLHDDFQRQVDNIQTFGTDCPVCSAKENGLNHRNDLTGKTFGRLTVLGPDPNDDGKNGIRYLCQCSCENHTVKSILGSHLTSGKITSCGCYWLEQISGENNHSWKGGISGYNREGRNTLDYTHWHADVLRKDHYTCQCCGAKRHLEAHHILNFSDNIDLRYELTNGITLCHDCHAQTVDGGFHRIYGTSNNTPEQLEEYINNKRAELEITEHFSLEEYIRKNREYEEYGIT